MEKLYFRHNYGARNSSRIRKIEHKYKDNIGYAMFFKTLEYMFENGGYVMNDDVLVAAESCRAEPVIYQEFLDYCCDIGSFYCDEDGNYSSDNITERINKITSISNIRSEAGKKGGKKKKEKKDVQLEVEYEAEPEPPTPKPPKQVKEKQDIEATPQIEQLRKFVDAIMAEYPDSRNGKNELTNSQYKKLIDKFGYDKLVLMQRYYFEWKATKKGKTSTTDFGTLNKAGNWPEERAIEELEKQGKPAQKKASAPDRDTDETVWKMPFPKPEGWDNWHNDQKLLYRKEKMREISDGRN